jgi:hypothetical protein
MLILYYLIVLRNLCIFINCFTFLSDFLCFLGLITMFKKNARLCHISEGYWKKKEKILSAYRKKKYNWIILRSQYQEAEWTVQGTYRRCREYKLVFFKRKISKVVCIYHIYDRLQILIILSYYENWFSFLNCIVLIIIWPRWVQSQTKKYMWNRDFTVIIQILLCSALHICSY